MKKTVDRKFSNTVTVTNDNKKLRTDIDVQDIKNISDLKDDMVVSTTPVMYAAIKEHEINAEHTEEVFDELNDRRVIAPTDGDPEATIRHRDDDYITSERVINYCTQPEKAKMQESLITEDVDPLTLGRIDISKLDMPLDSIPEYLYNRLVKNCADWAFRKHPNMLNLSYWKQKGIEIPTAQSIGLSKEEADILPSEELYACKIDYLVDTIRLTPPSDNDLKSYAVQWAKDRVAKQFGATGPEYFVDEVEKYQKAHSEHVNAKFGETAVKMPFTLWQLIYNVLFDGTVAARSDCEKYFPQLASEPYYDDDIDGQYVATGDEADIGVLFTSDADHSRIETVADTFNLKLSKSSVSSKGSQVVTLHIPEIIEDVKKSLIDAIYDATDNLTAEEASVDIRGDWKADAETLFKDEHGINFAHYSLIESEPKNLPPYTDTFTIKKI